MSPEPMLNGIKRREYRMETTECEADFSYIQGELRQTQTRQNVFPFDLRRPQLGPEEIPRDRAILLEITNFVAFERPLVGIKLLEGISTPIYHTVFVTDPGRT